MITWDTNLRVATRQTFWRALMVCAICLPCVTRGAEVIVQTELFDDLDWYTQERILKGLPNLEELLTQAMANSPEIIASKAKVTLAESELQSKQLEVARNIGSQREEWKKRLTQLERLKTELDSYKNSPATDDKGQPLTQAQKTRDKQYVKILEQKIAESQVQVEQAKRELQSLVGKTMLPSKKDAPAPANAQPISEGPIAGKLKTALKGQLSMQFAETPLSSVLEYLEQRTHTKFVVQSEALHESGTDPNKTLITISLSDISLCSALQALEDQVAGIQFVVRDYGILLTTTETARYRADYLSAVQFGKEAQAAAKDNSAKDNAAK